MNQKTTTKRHSYTTKEDFLRWLRERKILIHQQAIESQTTQAQLMAEMVWSDDGGQSDPTNAKGKP